MSRTRQILVACGTFSVALGIGFVMQNGDALAARFSEAPAPAMPLQSPSDVVATPVAMRSETVAPAGAARIAQLIAASRANEGPLMPAAAVTTANMIELTQEEAAPTDPTATMQLAAIQTELPPPVPATPILAAPDCSVSLIADVMPAAMVELALSAPCSPDAKATIHHQGMMFSVLTDAEGRATVAVPALVESAVFLADLATGTGAVAVTTVPDMANYDRAVLQWQGQDGPEIHALEFGAAYGETGHVWHGAARDAAYAMTGDGGFLVRLGDPEAFNPLMAEVYTYPSGQSRRDGAVDFTVETPVTAANCGREMAAQTIQVSPGAQPISLDLEMTIPDCESLGEFLVLNHMLFDLTLAAR
jgi:hypothetical protein